MVKNRTNLAGSLYMHYNRAVLGTSGGRRFLAFSVLFFCIPICILFGRQASWMTGRSNPADLQIQLVTIAPGDELYTWWGHSAIIVTDTRLGESRFYNYGLFSFETENFFSNFALGRLWFEVGAMPTQAALHAYRQRNRSIIIQTLNVSPEKRAEISRFVEINVLPENRRYLYDHYYDNCSTRIRDILDMASGGALYERTDVPADTTFRRITRRFSGRHFFADTLLMFLMGQSIDEPITLWETMFLPTELSEIIDTLMIEAPGGEIEPFVIDRVVWNRATGRKPIPESATTGVPLALFCGGGVFLVIALIWYAIRRKPAARRIVFGIASCFAGFVIGLPGIILLFMSLFTDHAVTYWNENLFLANPLTFLALPLGIFTAAGFQRLGNITAWLWILLAAVGVLYIALKPFPFLTSASSPSPLAYTAKKLRASNITTPILLFTLILRA